MAKRTPDSETDKDDQAPKPSQTPSLGRVVRYVLGRGQERAAVIAGVGRGGVVQLQVFKAEPGDLAGFSNCVAGGGAMHPTALLGSVAYDEDGAVGTWHWPDRE